MVFISSPFLILCKIRFSSEILKEKYALKVLLFFVFLLLVN